jgi:hypothetical protein
VRIEGAPPSVSDKQPVMDLYGMRMQSPCQCFQCRPAVARIVFVPDEDHTVGLLADERWKQGLGDITGVLGPWQVKPLGQPSWLLDRHNVTTLLGGVNPSRYGTTASNSRGLVSLMELVVTLFSFSFLPEKHPGIKKARHKCGGLTKCEWVSPVGMDVVIPCLVCSTIPLPK